MCDLVYWLFLPFSQMLNKHKQQIVGAHPISKLLNASECFFVTEEVV